MSLRLLADDGSLAAWAPASPPRVRLLAEPRGARTRAVAGAARGALAFLGFEPADASAAPADLSVSSVPGPGPRLIVGPSSDEEPPFATRGFTDEDFHYLCLKTHPRKALAFSWEALGAARSELEALRASARALAGVTLEPSSRGLTGYQHRFREALSRDFDFPEALSCVWDGLRPGALSPGSKAAFLRAALPALGLVPFSAGRS